MLSKDTLNRARRVLIVAWLIVLAIAAVFMVVGASRAEAHTLSLAEAQSYTRSHINSFYPSSCWAYHSAIRINSTALKLRYWGCNDHSKRLGCTADHDHTSTYMRVSCVRWWY